MQKLMADHNLIFLSLCDTGFFGVEALFTSSEYFGAWSVKIWHWSIMLKMGEGVIDTNCHRASKLLYETRAVAILPLPLMPTQLAARATRKSHVHLADFSEK